ncbi:MAG: 3-isopropylmalate dehydrogenase [Hespellia sp.]|nr:3-isopropylmalate dehydrogenase [Hespellia sp.]
MEEKKKVQWHPAFAQALQIELEEESENLEFEEEHLLGSKPMQIDVLVVKKIRDIAIRKNIGRIFRKHNIIEYKSPEDSFSINDFYKVYGYACFYQSDTEKISVIDPEELTITIVCNQYPRKVIKHLEACRGIKAHRKEKGIYYLEGDPILIQLLVTKELTAEANLWIRSLRTDITSEQEISYICNEYEKHKSSKKYAAAMDAIMRGNWEKMKEVKYMCDAIKELFAEELAELEMIKKEREAVKKEKEAAEKEKEAAEKEREAAEKRKEAAEKEKNQLSCLIAAMGEAGESEQIPRLVSDAEFLQQMLEKYQIQ